MASSSSLTPLSSPLSTNRLQLLRPHSNVFSSFLNFRFSKPLRSIHLSSASVVDKNQNLEVSWLTPHTNSNDYGGWAIVEETRHSQGSSINKKTTKDFWSYLVSGAGVSTVILVAAIACSSFTQKGFKLNLSAPSSALQRLFTPANSSRSSDSSKTASTSTSNTNFVHSEVAPESSQQIDSSESVKKPPERVIITVAADSTQEEALQLLKKLKIIDDDVKADALCTRRQYARWLLKANSALERNPKHRISMLPSGYVVQAFDDVNFEDPDFRFIQALAESGIVLSKLSDMNNSSELDGPEVKEGVKFYPESFISRLDLINWRAQLEYSRMLRIQEISTEKFGFLDVSTISSEASSEFFMDMMAGDKSILRKVFGQSRRFQPKKPATKAQAAVTLTSGRMAEAIRTEICRLETEHSSMLAEMEEIKSEMLLRGEIQRLWDEKFNEVKAYGQEVELHFSAAINDLEQERNVREKSLNENLRERAALDCQKKLLVNLKEEVDEISERLACERADFAVEQKNLQEMFVKLQATQDAMVEAKSILEAEKEALRMLRSWIEDEARRSQARAEVLEKVGRRWKWNEEA